MKVFFKNHNFILFFLSSNLFFVFLKDWNKTQPILKENNCQLIYCEQSKFNTNECSINNTIIKTQWLNNIIRISEDYFRYINVVSNRNGDIFIETSPVTEGHNRIFYALKANGRFYFQNEETPFYKLDEMSIGLRRHYSELYNIVLNNDKEYLMSISTNGSVEIYDFDNNQRKYTTYNNFIQMENTYASIYNYGFTFEYFNNYYIIFPFYVHEFNQYYGENDYMYVNRYHFSDSIDISDSNSYEKNLPTSALYGMQGKMISCFKSNSFIYCLFHHIEKIYKVSVYNLDLVYFGLANAVEDIIEDLYLFFKGVQLKEEIIAIYYYPPSSKVYGHLLIGEIIIDNINYQYILNKIIDIEITVQLNNQLY